MLPLHDDDRANRESLALAGRPDIDAAMILALRNAVVPKNSFPMLGHVAPEQNLVGTANPRGTGSVATGRSSLEHRSSFNKHEASMPETP